jgi:hypothetical protein
MSLDTAEIIKRLDRIEKHLEAKRTRTWVKVGIVHELTGWDREGMRKARESNLIKQRKGVNGIEYLLESIPPMFIKKS